jgi:hypothetical protein
MLLLIIQVALVVFIAVLACKWSIRCHVRPSVWLAVVSTLAGSILFWLGDVLIETGSIPKYFWSQDGKTGLYVLPTLVGLSSMIALIPATIVVFIYQRRARR